METNALPKYDKSDNPTGCCPRFKPEGWEAQELHFEDKLFVKAKTRSLFHIPLNIGSVFPKTFKGMERAGAVSEDEFIVLSQDTSPWTGVHYFSAAKDVPDHEMIRLSGDFLTKVFEGPFKEAPQWCREMEEYVKMKGHQVDTTYFFYTTCP